MHDIKKWNVSIPYSLYNELKHISIDEAQTINEFCKPAIDIFINELIKLRDATLATRKKQYEDAKLASENPLVVTGRAIEPISEIIEPQTC